MVSVQDAMETFLDLTGAGNGEREKVQVGKGQKQAEATRQEFETILDEAARVVDGPRMEDYGSPADNHGRTAKLFSTYLGIEVTARQVCILNMLQKISRDINAPKRDNLVDIAGYARNCELVDDKG